MSVELGIQYLLSGITYGCIYAIVAVGFNIIYNATGIINFAQGEFVMLGGMLAHAFSLSMPLLPAIALSVLCVTFVGALVERVFIRSLESPSLLSLSFVAFAAFLLGLRILFPSEGAEEGSLGASPLGLATVALALSAALAAAARFVRPVRALFMTGRKASVLKMIILTIGVSILIREIALTAWGEQVRTLAFFSGSEVSSISVFGAGFSPQILWVIGVTGFVVAGLGLFFKRSLAGKAMRACAASVEGARLCGIDPRRMISLSFMLSAGIGALAGCVTAPLTQTHYGIGTGLAIKGFTVAVFGGLGNAGAAVAAGFILGILESFSIIIFPEAYKDIVTICVLLAILFVRPNGLFGSRELGRLKDY